MSDPAIPTESWALESDAAAWEAYARAACEARVPGDCVLDASPKTILSYEQGNLSLVARDLTAVFPPTLAREALETCDAAGLGDAFDLRRNVVNLKKVLLHSWHAAEPLEKELRQLSTFFRCVRVVRHHRRRPPPRPALPCPDPSPRSSVSPRRKDMSYENGFVNIERHREICVAHMTCKGAAHAVYDARVVAKQICCIPRHPSAPRPARLEQLPKSLTTLSWLEQAHRELGEGEDEGEDEGEGEGEGDAASAASSASSSSSSPHPASASGQLARFSALARARLPRWPPHLLHHLELVLIARGGVKALSIRAETKLWASTLGAVARKFFAATRRLESTRRSVEEVLRDDVGARDGKFVTPGSYARPGAIDALSAANRVDRLLNLARGVGPVTLDVADAAARVCERPAVRWFAAGDAARGTASDFVPSDFKTGALIARHKPVAARWRSEMRATLERAVGDGRWPPIGDALLYVTGRQPCRRCGGSFSNLWVSNGACFRCEEELRAAGTCPFRGGGGGDGPGAGKGGRCPPGAFCPHHRRCVACERWSCDACGVRCGDGEDVAALVESEQPRAVFLDFDRTLCTTKSGANPMRGRHVADPDLLAVAASRPETHVVTRNSHVDDVAAWMRANGVREPRVHHVGKGVSKGRVIADILRGLESREDDETAREERVARDDARGGGGEDEDGEERKRVRGVFADDGVAELLDPEVAAIPGLVRVLFSRVVA